MDDLTWLLPAEGTTEQWERNAHGWEGGRPGGEERPLLRLRTLENCLCLVFVEAELGLRLSRSQLIL